MAEPWLEGATSLVDAFRERTISPLEALDACIDAIEHSQLNAFSHTDFETAREQAVGADVSLPFGGVPFGVKELETCRRVAVHRSLHGLRRTVGEDDQTSVTRLASDGGAACRSDDCE